MCYVFARNHLEDFDLYEKEIDMIRITASLFLPFQSFCHSGWLLIARFSNNDGKNWMKNSGGWWYDRRNAAGATTDPSVNADNCSHQHFGWSKAESLRSHAVIILVRHHCCKQQGTA